MLPYSFHAILSHVSPFFDSNESPIGALGNNVHRYIINLALNCDNINSFFQERNRLAS